MTPELPLCPRCGNNRQVWKNQITGKLTCHRVGCHVEVMDTLENNLRATQAELDGADAVIANLKAEVQARTHERDCWIRSDQHKQEQLAAMKAERDEADAYILSLWRNNLLPRPMSNNLMLRLSEKAG